MSSDKNFGAHIDRTLKKIRSAINKSFRENTIDLTPEQWVVLSLLHEKDGQSQKEIADSSYKDAPTTSRIVDLLVKKKYLKREAVKENRRQYQVFLSRSGRVVVKKAIPIVNQIRIDGWKGLSNADYKKLLEILDKVSNNFDRMKSP